MNEDTNRKYETLPEDAPDGLKLLIIKKPNIISTGIGGYSFKDQKGFDTHQVITFCYKVLIDKNKEVTCKEVIETIEKVLNPIFYEHFGNICIELENIYFRNNGIYVEFEK